MSDTKTTDRPRLRLRAKDAEDLAILSSSLQDALAPIIDMTFEPAQRRFVMVVNRFKWESAPVDWSEVADTFGSDEQDELPSDAKAYFRTNCGVRFHTVRSVRRRGIELADRGTILNLLAIRWHDSAIWLDFAGGAALSLSVDRLDCLLEDLGEPWITHARPDHADEETPAAEPADAEEQS